MSDKKPLIDPKDLVPAAIGVVVGIGMLIGFVILAQSIGLTLFVDKADIPYQ